MSIDKTVKTDKIELNTTIWFGIHKGCVPAKLIQERNMAGINYLFWMRTVRNEKGFPRFMFNEDLHHVLDDLIRKNLSAFGHNETKYSETDYNVWRAEKRLERKKAEIKKEQETKRKQKEIAEFQEQERLKSQAIKQRQEEYLAKRAIEQEKLKRLEEERELTYSNAWGTW